jgi:hypothetical protein
METNTNFNSSVGKKTNQRSGLIRFLCLKALLLFCVMLSVQNSNAQPFTVTPVQNITIIEAVKECGQGWQFKFKTSAQTQTIIIKDNEAGTNITGSSYDISGLGYSYLGWGDQIGLNDGNYQNDTIYGYITKSPNRIVFSKTAQDCRTDPELTVSKSTLALPMCSWASVSDSESFTIAGVLLQGDITISSLDEGIKFSSDNSLYSDDLTIPQASGESPQTVYVRYEGTDFPTATDTISCATTGGATKKIAVTVQAVPPALHVSTNNINNLVGYVGTAPEAIPFTVTGTCLSGDITLTTTDDFEISTTSATTGFTDEELTLSSPGGEVWVRLKAGLDLGEYPGSIEVSNETAGITSLQTIALSGKIVPPFTVEAGQGIISVTEVSKCAKGWKFEFSTNNAYSKMLKIKENGIIISLGVYEVSGLGFSYLGWENEENIGLNNGNYSDRTLYGYITTNPNKIEFSEAEPDCSTNPKLTVSKDTLPLPMCSWASVSESGSFTITGVFLQGDITISSSNEGIKFSNDNSLYSDDLTISKETGESPQTVYVRYEGTGFPTATISCATTGGATQDITVTVQKVLPALHVSTINIDNLGYAFGREPEAKSFTVTGGECLSGDITLTATAGFEISTTNATTGFADGLTLSSSGGEVWVRLKAGLDVGTYSGSITVSNEKESIITSQTITVSGKIVPPFTVEAGPNGITSVTEVSKCAKGWKFEFTTHQTDGEQTLLIKENGTNVSELSYEISGCNYDYKNWGTVYVGNKDGNGMYKNATLYGYITTDPKKIVFSETAPDCSTDPKLTVSESALSLPMCSWASVSESQSFTITGVFLQGDITISSLNDGIKFSRDGSSYTAGPLTISKETGESPQTVYVRYEGTGFPTATISCETTGGTTQNIAVTVQEVLPALQTSTTDINNLVGYVGTASAAIPFTVTGTCLSGDITLTATADFEISTTSATTGFADRLTLSSSGGQVWVRLKAGLDVGFYSGSITVSNGTAGITPQTIALSGEIAPLSRTFYLRNSGNWSDLNSWSLTCRGSAVTDSDMPITQYDDIVLGCNNQTDQTLTIDIENAVCKSIRFEGDRSKVKLNGNILSVKADFNSNKPDWFVDFAGEGSKLEIGGNIELPTQWNQKGFLNTADGTIELTGCGQSINIHNANNFTIGTFIQSATCTTKYVKTGGTITITTHYDQNCNPINLASNETNNGFATGFAGEWNNWDEGLINIGPCGAPEPAIRISGYEKPDLSPYIEVPPFPDEEIVTSQVQGNLVLYASHINASATDTCKWYKKEEDGSWTKVAAGDSSYTTSTPGLYRAAIRDSVSNEVLFRLPATFIWTGSVGSNWNDINNWDIDEGANIKKISMTKYDDIQISGDAADYPELTDTVRCNNIHFMHGATIGKIHNLKYNNASAEITLKPFRWYMLASPLDSITAGNFYRDGLLTYIRYFSVKGGTGEWSKTVGDKNVPLTLCKGFAIQTFDMLKPMGDVTFTLPLSKLAMENGDSYHPEVTIDLNGEHLADPNTGIKNETGYVMVSNPFLSHLDLDEFFAANPGINKYVKVYSNEDSRSGTFSDLVCGGDPALNTEAGAPNKIAPFQAFFIDPGNIVSENGTLTLKFDAEKMSSTCITTKLRNTQIPDDILRIKATIGGITSGDAVVTATPEASNEYVWGEDSRKLLAQESTIEIFTMAGDIPCDINLLNRNNLNSLRIPININTNQTGILTLEIDGAIGFISAKDILLYDSESGDITSLLEKNLFEIDKTSSDNLEGRFYLIFEQNEDEDSTTDNIEEKQDEGKVFVGTIDNHLVVESRGELILSVTVYDIAGKTILSVGDINKSSFNRSLYGPMTYIVKVVTDKRVLTAKVVIK